MNGIKCVNSKVDERKRKMEIMKEKKLKRTVQVKKTKKWKEGKE